MRIQHLQRLLRVALLNEGHDLCVERVDVARSGGEDLVAHGQRARVLLRRERAVQLLEEVAELRHFLSGACTATRRRSASPPQARGSVRLDKLLFRCSKHGTEGR